MVPKSKHRVTLVCGGECERGVGKREEGEGGETVVDGGAWPDGAGRLQLWLQ